MYEYWDYEFEKVKSDQEVKMNNKGYKFITNFKGKKEQLYREASKVHNLNYEINNEAYSGSGKLLDFDNYKSFYVDSSIIDLSDFWRTFEQLEKEMIK